MFDDLGLTETDFDFDDLDNDPPPPPRPRWQRDGWWTPTTAEAWHLDLPDFADGQDRAFYMIREMGRSALALVDGATADDAIFPTDEGVVSLNDLLASVSRDAVDEISDRLD